MKSNNRDTDVESKRMDTEGKKAGWDGWKIGTDICTLLFIEYYRRLENSENLL